MEASISEGHLGEDGLGHGALWRQREGCHEERAPRLALPKAKGESNFGTLQLHSLSQQAFFSCDLPAETHTLGRLVQGTSGVSSELLPQVTNSGLQFGLKFMSQGTASVFSFLQPWHLEEACV